MSALYGQDVLELRAKARRGTQWFYWIAGLSLVNTLALLFKGNFSFLAGLGVTQIVDAVSNQMLGSAGPYVSVGVAVLAAAVLCAFGYFSARGSRAALITGMVLYALDGGLFLYFGDYLPAAFHGFVLFQLWQGWQAWQQIAKLRAESAGFAGAVDGPPLM